MKILGLDCATVDAKVGLALGVLGDGGLEIQHATLCTRERAAASVIADWVRDAQARVLIAIDAPLGWPRPFAETLINHSAGMPFEAPANALLRRATDLFILKTLNKTPLDVAADIHPSQRSRYIRRPLWLPTRSGRVGTKGVTRLSSAVRFSSRCARSLPLANRCPI